jgi:type I restriction enzyme S subunit
MIDIPDGWEEKKLLGIGKVVSGTTPNTDIQEFWGNDYIWLTPNDLKKDNNLNLTSSQRMISEKGMKTFFSSPIPKDSLIISTRAPIGYVGIVRDEYSTNQGCKSLICFDNQCVDYHYYSIKDNVKKLRFLSTGTTFEEISKKDLENTSFIIPKEKKEQEKIAEILSEADCAIDKAEAYYEKNRKIKTALMQDLLTHGIDEKGKIRDPKTHQYKASPLGDIPMEWDYSNIGQSIYLKARIGWQGLTTKEYLTEGEYFLVTGTDFMEGKINWNTCHYVDYSRFNQDKKIQLEKNDILVTKDGTIGKVSFIDNLIKPTTLNSGVFVLRPLSDEIDAHFLFYILKSFIFDKFIENLSAGSTINHLYQKDFVKFEFPVPIDENEQQKIAKILSSQDEKIEKAKAKLEKLKSIKTALMQDLLSGTKRVNHLLGEEI